MGARDRYLSKGFQDYLTKPIDSVYLEAMLKKYIPDEKIEAVDDNPEETREAHPAKEESIFERLRKAGVDTDRGIAFCGGDENFYLEVLGEYLKASDEKREGLRKAFAEGDMENYGVLAHSLKSTSATIGAAELSQMALALENAAAEKNVEVVRREQGAVFEKYEQLLDRIRECIPEEEEEAEFSLDDDEIMDFMPSSAQ